MKNLEHLKQEVCESRNRLTDLASRAAHMRSLIKQGLKDHQNDTQKDLPVIPDTRPAPDHCQPWEIILKDEQS